MVTYDYIVYKLQETDSAQENINLDGPNHLHQNHHRWRIYRDKYRFFRPLLGYCRNVILEVDCGTELERGGDEIIRSSSIGPSKIRPMNDSGGDVLLYMWSTSH